MTVCSYIWRKWNEFYTRKETEPVLRKTLEAGGNLLAFYSSRLFAVHNSSHAMLYHCQSHVRLLKSTTLHGRSLSRTFRTPGQILNAIPVELNISQCGGHAVKILRNPAKEGFRDHIADESRQQGDRLASLTVSAHNLASSIYRIQYSAHHTSIQATSSGWTLSKHFSAALRK